MRLEPVCVLLEDHGLLLTDVAEVLCVSVTVGLDVSQCSELVHYDTEDNVQADDVDNDLEGRIVRKLETVLLRIVIEMNWLGGIANTATVP